MNFLRLLPVIVSLLLLSAHFYRAGETLMAVLPVVFLIPLMSRKSWVPRLTQLVLLLGAAEWVYTLFSIAQIRMQFGAPWVRMAVILGAVALFTALSGLIFRGRSLRQQYAVTDS